MPSDPLRDSETLQSGSVVMVAKLVQPRDGSNEYWWRSFRVITDPPERYWIKTAVLRMEIDPDKDFITVDMRDDRHVVTSLAEHEIPQGVSAMLMKHTLRGTIEIVPF